jgi:DNA-binding response OmpR family regulator
METPPAILLVDDEKPFTDHLAPFLERAGFVVDIAANGEEALEKVAHQRPDLIILDILMPVLDGRAVLRRLRQAGDWIPIIMLTVVKEVPERIMALQEGADDYINKPFEPLELVARIEAVLRRVHQGQQQLASSQKLACHDLVFERLSRHAWLGTKELNLSQRGAALLEFFMTHPQAILSREHLLDAVWGWDAAITTRVVDARVAELRGLLNDDRNNPRYIETVRGEGYRFLGPVEILA